MIETSDGIAKLTGAIIQVQGGISSVHRDKVNPHFKTRYATLENVIDTARPALQEAGIAFVQAPGMVIDGSVEITTMLVHESGEWMRSTLHVPLGKRDAQGVGSAITYGCRYSLMAMLGLPPSDDDDGQAASAPYSPPADKSKRVVGTNPKTGMRTAHSLKKELGKHPDAWDAFEQEVAEAETVSACTKLALAWSAIADRDRWPEEWRSLAKEQINNRKQAILNTPVPDDDTFPGDLPNGRNQLVETYRAG